MSRHSNRNGGISSFLRQLGAKQIVLPIGDGLSISWLTLQVILFFVACLVCSCCSLSSYVWGSLSPHITVPAPLSTPRPARTVLHTPATTDTSTPVGPSEPTSTRHLAEMVTPIAPTQTPAPEMTSQPSTPTPTSVPKPTTSPTLPPTSSPGPTSTGTPGPSAAPSGLHIIHVEYNPTGTEADEDSIADLEKELVIIENRGPDGQDMTGWTLNNSELDTYRFPDGFILHSEASVQVWAKSGTDTDAELYWGSEKEIWTNEGGAAYLRDHTGTLVDMMAW